MTIKNELLAPDFYRAPERLTLFSICCSCFRPNKDLESPSDIALMKYGNDEPHDYVLEKLVIKRIPVPIFGVEEDFEELEKAKKSVEKLVKVTEPKILQESVGINSHPFKKRIRNIAQQVPRQTLDTLDAYYSSDHRYYATEEKNSGESLKIDLNSPVDEVPKSKIEFYNGEVKELYHYKSIDTIKESDNEVVLRTITANLDDDTVTEIDHQIEKIMSPDLEKTIATLRAVKPRPITKRTARIKVPVRTSWKPGFHRTRPVTQDASIGEDNPLKGIHIKLNKTAFTPPTNESESANVNPIAKKDISTIMIQELESEVLDEISLVNKETSVYQDAAVNACEKNLIYIDDSEFSEYNSNSEYTIRDHIKHFPSDNKYDRKSICSSVTSSKCFETLRSRKLKRILPLRHKKENNVEKNDFTIYHTDLSSERGLNEMLGLHSSSSFLKQKNLKWKIIIKHPLKEKSIASTSSSEKN